MFKTRLQTEDIDPPLVRLLGPLAWDGYDALGRVAPYRPFVIPAGSVTDFGSTPQRLRRFKAFDPSRTARPESVVHDYLYRNGKWPDDRPCSRREADDFLRYAMLQAGYSSAVAGSWWLGVRVGGWKPWGEYRAAEADTGETPA